MSFDQFLEAVRTVAAENLPVVTGGVVAILVLSYLFVQYQKEFSSFLFSAHLKSLQKCLVQFQAVSK